MADSNWKNVVVLLVSSVSANRLVELRNEIKHCECYDIVILKYRMNVGFKRTFNKLLPHLDSHKSSQTSDVRLTQRKSA